MDQASGPRVLERLVVGEDLDENDARALMSWLMTGEADPTMTAGILVALRAKGEVPSEIAGFVRAMLDAATTLELPEELADRLVDTCGTGGDGAGTFNISTIASLVVAAAGVPVAKHGNRAASGTCGTADLLEAWGIDLSLPPAAVARCIEELGIGFLFARAFHPAMRHVAPVRAGLRIRTVFNVLGPLSNPAGATRQVVGVADPALAPIMAEALARLGKQRVLIVHGDDGLDELTTTSSSQVWELQDGEVQRWVLDPTDLGLAPARPEDLRGGEVADCVTIADAVLAGEPGPRADVVALNAAAALMVAGAVDDLSSGLERATQILSSGAAAELRDRWVARVRELADAPTSPASAG